MFITPSKHQTKGLCKRSLSLSLSLSLWEYKHQSLFHLVSKRTTKVDSTSNPKGLASRTKATLSATSEIGGGHSAAQGVC
mmetsp:Transcript_1410/g.2909  ORF Transcript_1410/g.2909 Transcript_1410/m.2909 type:complete len:80 (-) Transcript_1410:437-676(-)